MSRTSMHRFSPSEAYRAFVKTGATLPDDLLSLPSVEISNYKSLLGLEAEAQEEMQ